jgi:hypothetical protein
MASSEVCVGFEVLIAIITKSKALWDIKPCIQSFDPEKGGKLKIGNLCGLSADYVTLSPRR